jgi:maleylacetoacetate isomerase/maleylpyruvate isomerase
VIRLYTYFRSSAAFRVRIALNLKGVDYEAVPVHFLRNGGEHRQPEFLKTNPQGLLPVLDDGGALITQSLAIIEYLDSRYPSPRLIPEAPLARARVQGLAQIVACEIHPLNNLRVLQYLRKELRLDEPSVSRWVQHWIAESFRALETRVAEDGGERYCFGDAVSLADVCLVPQMYNARRFGCDLAPYPRLVRIDEGLRDLPAFLRAAPENQPDAE